MAERPKNQRYDTYGSCREIAQPPREYQVLAAGDCAEQAKPETRSQTGHIPFFF